MNERRRRLRALLESGDPLLAPACIDAFSARMVEQAGFHVNYLTGNGASAALLGRPDVGLMTLREVADVCRNISLATAIPLIADADTGYGNAINVIRTVRELELAGAACLQLEDQVTPKRCGHLPGSKPVVSLGEQVGKLKAALDARQDPDLLILARTDAAADHGLDEAIRRAHAFKEAGADLIFIEVDGTREELVRIGKEVPGPLAVTVDESRRDAPFSPQELAALGFRLIIYPGIIRCTYLKAVTDALRILKKESSTLAAKDRLASFRDYNQALGIEEINAWEEKYLSSIRNPA
ncbi:MAG: isocitrate lyase/PEP mutase family protein [Candidatus Tectomicrobia bacterium]|uniref:Isocitrate lyase/PEP mutase family protein n=1 Tax=Tectimicrobiota bacterium TaxID=2528274 RepID=A0A932HZG0_UNCTE|nr:isocitrate lyase/PEP mutase family protein [Candidatus Tectomicrobia bacterium]